MEPTISVGDVVFVVETQDINKDDIISFKVNNSVVTHRVIEVIIDDGGEKQYKTKGDANDTEDVGTVKPQDIEGKYLFKIGQVGNIILFLKSEVGIIIFVLILAMILFFGNSKSEKKEKDVKEEKTSENRRSKKGGKRVKESERKVKNSKTVKQEEKKQEHSARKLKETKGPTLELIKEDGEVVKVRIKRVRRSAEEIKKEKQNEVEGENTDK